MSSPDQLHEEIIQLKKVLNDMFVEHYLNYEIFSPIWWLSVALIVLPLFVWWKIVDKKRLLEICVFGLLANVLATFLDIGLSDHMMWEYPVRVLPQTALFLPVDYVIVPVIGMVLYQKFPTWGKFFLANAIASAFMSFVGEPIAVRIGMYEMFEWKYIYSFPIYIAMYMAIKFTTQILTKITKTTHSSDKRTKENQ